MSRKLERYSVATTYEANEAAAQVRQPSCSNGVRMARITTARRKTFETGASAQLCCRCRRPRRNIEHDLEELREQNRILMESAVFFAELSERLNVQLRRHRAQAHLEEVVGVQGPQTAPDALTFSYRASTQRKL